MSTNHNHDQLKSLHHFDVELSRRRRSRHRRHRRPRMVREATIDIEAYMPETVDEENHHMVVTGLNDTLPSCAYPLTITLPACAEEVAIASTELVQPSNDDMLTADVPTCNAGSLAHETVIDVPAINNEPSVSPLPALPSYQENAPAPNVVHDAGIDTMAPDTLISASNIEVSLDETDALPDSIFTVNLRAFRELLTLHDQDLVNNPEFVLHGAPFSPFSPTSSWESCGSDTGDADDESQSIDQAE